jgi:hypothetical protein
METKDAGAAPGASRPVEVRVDWRSEPPPVFSNFATIASKPEEFALVFCSISLEGVVDEGQTSAVAGRIVASVRTTPSAYYNLLQAMATVWNRWVEANPARGGEPRFVEEPSK